MTTSSSNGSINKHPTFREENIFYLQLKLKIALSVMLLMFTVLFPPATAHSDEHSDLIKSNDNFTLSKEESQFIKSLAPLRVMIDDNFIPLSTYDKNTQTFQGISVDLFRHVADKLGLKYQLLQDPKLSWSDKVELFNKHEVDLLMPVSITEERGKTGIFTTSFYDTYYGAIVKKSRVIKLKNTRELSTFKIGVTKASAIIPFIRTFVPDSQIYYYDNQSDLYKALRDDTVDIGLQNQNVFMEDRFNMGFVDLAMQHLIVESPRKYTYYLNKTEAFLSLKQIIDRYLAGADFSGMVTHYESREDELILRYAEQLHQKKLLTVGAACLFVLFVILLVLYLRHRKLMIKLSVSLEQVQQHQEELNSINTDLQLSEAKFRRYIEASPDGIFVADETGHYLEVNRAAVAITGYSEAELLNMLITNLIAPESMATALLSFKSLKDIGNSSHELMFLHKDGSKRWWSVDAVKLSDTRLLGFTKDITERKRAEDMLLKSELRHRTILKTAMDGICLVGSNGRIIEVNNAYCRMIGYNEPELLTRSISDIEHNEAPEETGAHIQRIKEQGEDRFNSRHRCKDGTIIDVEVSIQYQADNGGQMLVFLRNITDQKRAEAEKRAFEQQLLQTQKLESLGVLASGIAHDFNNILTVITGQCYLATVHPDCGADHILPIKQAAERAAGLCRQMLIYAGKGTFVLERLKIGELVEEMVRMLKSSINQNVIIKSVVAHDIPLLKGDANQLRQVIMNLIINASEAIGEQGGEVNVTLSKTDIQGDQLDKDYLGTKIPSGCYVCLDVTDDGSGMNEETIKRIFEPFYTTKFTGRGLGMSAVLGIISAHDGVLQLSSKPGHGTHFRILLPFQSSDTSSDNSSQQITSNAWQGSGTVLLVEDETHIAAIAKTVLERVGYKVIEACNGREALELFQKQSTDITVIMTDIGMPVMDGYALIRELKEQKVKIPIIITSGFGDADITSKISRDDFAGLVNKPYNFDILLDVLKGVV